MGKKYLLEIEENKDGSFAWSNFAPYAEPEPHAEVTADAYQRGYETAKHECENCPKQAYTDTLRMDVYHKGLSDAWEAARKICTNWVLPDSVLSEIFGMDKTIDDIMKENTAFEAIEKIRAYEQEKEEQIQVGDEVELKCGVSPAIYMQGTNGSDEIYLLFNDGSCGIHGRDEIECKTGRHFPEIAEVLAKMKETNNG